MSPVHLRELGIPRNQPEERTGLFRSRRSGFGKYDEWKDIKGNNAHTPIQLQIQQIHQARGVDRHGSSTSAPLTSQIPVPVKNGTHKVQPGFTLSITRGKLPEDISQRVVFQRAYGNYPRLESQHTIQTLRREGSQNQGESSQNPGYRGSMEPERAYSDFFRITRRRPTRLSSGFKPPRIQKSRGQESPFFTIPASFQDKTRIKGKEKNYFQQEEERIRTIDPEAV
ncbi:hypothetical protein O181_009046 [Austropuccinia psidii MF-1]|uniref:Uncharacterized protein n=1 Tax=Austropuccinia psidii MF-1 TaxID=1389203 RepID=A0A9Q3GJ39_9BASI|nr:hypothetical protein [Austropuccinia psidii MF-1]